MVARDRWFLDEADWVEGAESLEAAREATLNGLLAAPDTQAHMAAAPYVASAADAADGGAASDED